jgi:CBS domain-containing protein
MKIEDILTRDVAAVGPREGLDKAAAAMRDHDCGFVPVIDLGSRVVGVLTDRDICMAALETGLPLSEIRVADTMRTDVHVCRAEETLADVEDRMGRHQIRRMPVLDEHNRLAGVVSIDSIAREAVREAILLAPQVSTGEVGRTLGEISRPRLILQPEHRPEDRA